MEKRCLLGHVLVNGAIISRRTGANTLHHNLCVPKDVFLSAFGPRMILLVLKRLGPRGVRSSKFSKAETEDPIQSSQIRRKTM